MNSSLEPQEPFSPKCGEIWFVDLEPTRGPKMQKKCPALVLSANTIRPLPVHVIVPLTGRQGGFQSSSWKTKISPDRNNALPKDPAIDCQQIRCLSLERFTKPGGTVARETLEDVLDTVRYCLEE